MLMCGMLKQMGVQSLLESENGQHALEKFQSDKPNLILMDVEMPVMSGREAAMRIKSLDPDRWVPIIFITSHGSDEELVRCLEVGDGFLTKPVHLAILRAKIEAMRRVLQLQEQLRQKTAELERYYFSAEEERGLTAHLMKNMIDGPSLHDSALRSGIFPAEHHSGDVVAAARAPNQALHIMLADGTGHGLAAAINVMPLPQIFYAMIAKGFVLSSLAKELNAKAYSWMPRDRFVAATLAEINERDQCIKIWNGGNPNVVFIGVDGEVVHTFKSRHLPLGVLDEVQFEAHCETLAIEQPGQLVLVSDGLLEAENSAGKAYGWERMLQVLRNTQAELRYDAVLHDLLADHLAGGTAQDDVSLMIVNVGSETAELVVSHPTTSDTAMNEEEGSWRCELTFGASELRYFDVAPHILGLLEKIAGLKPHKTSLFLILSELFVNALDHGLLNLDSSLKTQGDGFDSYLRERELRLANLREGIIALSMERIWENGNRFLRIAVRDSGDGFNHEAWLPSEKASRLPHGRGLSLVHELAARLEFYHNGSEAVAYYAY